MSDGGKDMEDKVGRQVWGRAWDGDEKESITLAHDCHGLVCALCGEKTDMYANNTNRWPFGVWRDGERVALHYGCVVKLVTLQKQRGER